MVMHLHHGPEDWRLAYLSLGTLIVGFLGVPIMILASFLLARATISASDEAKQLGPQKWLVYPALIIVYGFLGFWFLFWPAVALGGLLLDVAPSQTIYLIAAIVFLAAGTGLWWFILFRIQAQWPRPVQWLFSPFLDNLPLKWTKRIGRYGFILFVVCTILGVALRFWPNWYIF